MKTNFFENIKDLQLAGDLRINIQNDTDGKMKVAVFLVNEKVDDKAKKMIPPLNFCGTPEKLDEGFFEALTSPVKQADGLLSNMQEFSNSLEQARKESKMEKDKEELEKKGRDDRKKKYDLQIKKVNELEEQKKFGEAIGAIPKETDFPEQADEIKTRLESLRKQHSTLSLF